MYTTKGRRWFALAAAFSFIIPAAQAEMITPDSIPNPPAAVGSANGTPVYAGNLVSTQYTGLGLTFNYQWNAVTSLNGVPVWVPVESSGTVTTPVLPPNYVWGHVNYYAPWYGASLNSLTTRNPITVSSLTVKTIGHPGYLSLHVCGRNGLPLDIAPVVQDVPGPSDEKIWRFIGSGIGSFSASLVPPPGVAVPALEINAPWGIAAVSFTPPAGQTPEPSSLLLAGLGALSLAARFGWRRMKGLSEPEA